MTVEKWKAIVARHTSDNTPTDEQLTPRQMASTLLDMNDDRGALLNFAQQLAAVIERQDMNDDRGALLNFAQQLAAVIERQARELGREVCPLCQDCECPAPLLEAR